MNKLYRVIWNQARRAWAVASEFARSAGKSGCATRGIAASVALTLAALSDPAAAIAAEAIDDEDKNEPAPTLLVVPPSPVLLQATLLGAGLNAYEAGGGAANGSGSVAIGSAARVDLASYDSIAIGRNAQVVDNSYKSIAIGADALVDGEQSSSSIAFGDRSHVGKNSWDSVAIGYGAEIADNADYGISLGTYARVLSNTSNGMALGQHALASHSNSVALGANSSTDRTNSVSVGSTWSKRQITNVAAGTTDSDAVTLGQLNALGSSAASALGSSYNSSTQSVAAPAYLLTNANGIGGTTGAATDVATGFSKVDSALGKLNNLGTKYFRVNSTWTGAVASGANALAAGYAAQASGSWSVAIGAQASAAGGDTVAVGTATDAQGQDSVVIGTGASTSTTAPNAVALGAGASATATDSVALGSGSVADRAQSVSVGGVGSERQITNVKAGSAGTDAVNLAQLNNLGSSTASALGSSYNSSTQSVAAPAYLLSNANTLAGTSGAANNVASGFTKVDSALGKLNTAGSKYFQAKSSGTGSVANGSDSLAVGPNAKAESKDSIAMGNGASTLIDTASQDKLGRNLALGNLAKSDREYAMAFGYKAHANGDSSIALGAETWARGYDSIALGTRAGTAADWSTALGADSSAKAVGSTATGYKAQAAATNSTALGREAQANHQGSVALGYGATTDRTNSVSVGKAGSERQITNVKAGTQSTDAVNLSQLNSVTAAATANAVQYDNAGKTSVTLQGASGTVLGNVADGEVSTTSKQAVNGRQLNATNQDLASLRSDALLWDSALGAYKASRNGNATKITGVARGDVSATSSDAVNGAQLFELGQDVDSIDGRVTTIETSIGSIASGGGIKYFHASSSKVDAVASGADSLAAGPAAQASGAQSTAVGNAAQASGSNALAMGNQASASGANSTAVGSQASASGSNSTAIGNQASATGNNAVALGDGSVADRDNSVSVGSAGNERQITNVAAGTAATDAVNKGQLDGAVADAKQYTDSTVTTLNGDVQNMGNRVTNVEGDVGKLKTGQDGMFQTSAVGAKPVASGSNAVAGGVGAVASAANSTAIGTHAKASAEHAVALGHGASATAQNSVALGANSVAERANSVSVGAAGNERQITNVAAGTQDTDAVNLAQLNKSVADVAADAYGYTNSVFNTLRHDIKELDDELSAGIAGAMAMASLPQPHVPGASMTSVGVGNFRGQSALAVGASHISADGKWVTKLQGTASEKGETGVSVGIGYQW
ncbi:YadA-like family protein [Pseudomonas sp. UL073]|uniref:YadA-like family protein n=1 Tax=Zestomonas insulae TaxID=2809017 RepID=A0ABS2IAE5_9GAMM|nr:YadA-like family protein [Pseudomonas insulae]MBM7059638.1 YadA-like family protein [Pseudomonas insulae]